MALVLLIFSLADVAFLHFTPCGQHCDVIFLELSFIEVSVSVS